MINLNAPLALLAYLLPVLCCLCYGIILVFQRSSKAKRLLGVIMLVGCLCFTMSLIKDSIGQHNGRVPIAGTWHMMSVLLIRPITGWYLALLFRPDTKFFPKRFVHFLPFIASVVCTLSFRLFGSDVPPVYSLKEFIALLPVYPEAIYRLVLEAIFIAQVSHFYLWANKQLKNHLQQIKNDFSYTKKVNLLWVHIVNLMFVGTAALNLVYLFTGSIEMRMLFSVIFFVFNMILCVCGGTQPDIYYIQRTDVRKENMPALPRRYGALFTSPTESREKISPVLQEKIRQGLLKALEEKALYTKPDLRLDDLAEALNTNKTYVSLVINEHFKVSFYHLINSYRIRKAITLLNNTDLQIKDVWIQSGFNSQSSFNAFFKKETGTTPSEWINNGASGNSVRLQSWGQL